MPTLSRIKILFRNIFAKHRADRDLDEARGAVLVRRGKGGKRREVGMDRWAWAQLDPWMEIRRDLPIGALEGRGFSPAVRPRFALGLQPLKPMGLTRKLPIDTLYELTYFPTDGL